MLWLRKFTALLLISTGAALVFLPFPERLSGERSREVIHLEVQPAPFTESSAKNRFGAAFVKFSYEGLTDYPDILDAVLGLWGRSGTRCVSENEWKTLLADQSLEDGTGMVYAFRDGLHRIVGAEKNIEETGTDLICLEVIFLGAYDNREWNPLHHLKSSDLEKYPELKAAIEKMTAGPVPAEAAVDVSPRQWRRFHNRLLDNSLPASFVVQDRMITGTVDKEPAPWSLDVPRFRTVFLITGIAALLLGMTMGLAVYRAVAVRSGIPVVSPWLGVFCDLILVAGGIFCVTVAVDTLWVGPLGQKSLLGLEPEWMSSQKITGLHFVSIPLVFIALPLFSLWVTSLCVQRIIVDDKGVTSLGALGSISMSWEDLRNIRLRDQRNPFAFTVMDFRRLQRVLDLESSDQWAITINEPSSRRRKQMLLEAFERHIPEAKHDLIGEIKKW